MGNHPSHSIRPRIRVVVRLFLLTTLIAPMAAPATAAPTPPTPPEAALAGQPQASYQLFLPLISR